MVVLDALLVIVFAALAVYYGMRASRQQRDGNPGARWSWLVCVLVGLAAVAWAAALVIELS